MPRKIGVSIVINDSEALKRIAALDKKTEELRKHMSGAFTLGGASGSAQIDKAYQSLMRMGTAIGHVNTAQVSNLSSMRQWVRAQDDMRGGIVKAAGATTNAAGTFQKYKVAVDAGGNTTRNFTLSVNTATGEVLQLDNGIRTVSNSFEMLSKRAAGFIAQTVGFNGVAQSMRMAFTEMKRMSDELVTYQKVTGASGAQLAQVRATSYASAKAYGQTPSDFLASVSEFARAGYKQQSADMANLATKTQLVGDITAEMASSFLLATDAGYKLHGNVKQLNSVLDAANEIDNKYATSIAKIAEGMTLTASLANQMNVPIEQLMAGLGTMTAVTQRSGSEMGRALRSVMLTVMKDTTTEVEEGVTVTTDQIKSLQDALNKYASDAVKAANATGKLLNPMDALGSLAKAYQDGLLNDQSLTGILSGIGGQRYSNALIALVQNWDEVYTRMLGDISEAAGSADAEVSAMTNSWTAKLNRFKTTWTETVNNTINEDSIKNWIDLGIGVLEYTGNLENLTAVVGGLAVAYKALRTAMGPAGFTSKTAWGIGAGLAITAVGMIKSEYDQYYAELQASADKAAEDAAKAAETVTTNTQTAISALKELQGMDKDGNGFIDNDKLNEAKTLNEQIVALIGEQANAYSLVSDKVSEITEKIIEQTIAANNAKLDEIRIAEATAANNFAGQKINNRLFYERGTWQIADGYKLHSASNAAFIEGFSNQVSSSKYFDLYNKSDRYQTELYIRFDKPEEVESMLAMLDDLKHLQLWMANEGYSSEYSNIFDDITDIIGSYETLLNPILNSRDSKRAAQASNFLLSNLGANAAFSTGKEYDAYIENLIKEKGVQDGLANAIRETADAYESLYVQEKKQEDTTDAASTQYGNLAEQIDKATTAKEAFDKAMSTTMADGLEGYKEAFETLKKEIDEGRVNSTAAHAAYRMLLGDEAHNLAGGNAARLRSMYEQASQSYDTLFGTYRNEHGDIVQGGGFLKLAERAGVNVRDSSGNYAYRFSERDLNQIAEYSKLSKEIIMSALSALDQYDITGVNKGLLKEQEPPEITATKENTTATEDNTAAVKELSTYIGSLNDPVVEPGAGGSRKTPSGITSSGMVLPDEIRLKNFYTQLYKNVDPVVLKTELDLSEAERQLRYFTGKKFTLYGSAFIGSDTPGGTQIGMIGGNLKDLVHSVRGYADGTDGHPGGAALVNDGVGSNAGGELIVQGGRAFIANGGRPALVKLDRGARVFSAKDTRSILRGGVPAYAAGNGSLSEHMKPSYIVDNASGGINVGTLADTGLGFSGLYEDKDTPAVVYKTFSALAELMEYILNRLGTALSEQTEAIDGQIKALQEARNAADTQKELEERQEAVAEAQKDLQDAMNERTVRVLNDDGSWSWQTDARKVQQAQDSLKDAEEALKEYQDDLAFEAQVKALEAEKERLQKEYETIKNRWDEIKGGVSTPIGNLDSVLASILKGGSSAEKTGAQAVKDLLIGTLLTGGSFSGNYAEALDSLAGAASGKPVMPGVNGLNLAALIAGSGTGATDDMITAALSQNSGVLGGFSGGASYSVNKSINNYFNGVHIGSEMLSLPLSETIRRLAVYDNA